MKCLIITIALCTLYTKVGVQKKIIHTPIEFSESNLIKLIKQEGIKYPEIALAQAKIETGHFKSNVFKNNNNAFGMKLAKNRPTTAIGEDNNHATYISWVQSVKDYKLWQNRIINKLQTRKKYLNYLDKYYATNKKYVNLIKQMI